VIYIEPVSDLYRASLRRESGLYYSPNKQYQDQSNRTSSVAVMSAYVPMSCCVTHCFWRYWLLFFTVQYYSYSSSYHWL